MTKRLTGYAAAALTTSLVLGGFGTAYGAPLTLAGFGADLEVEFKEAAPAAQPETTAETAAETAAPAEASAPANEIVPETDAAETAAETEVQTEAQTEAPIDRSMVDTTGFSKAEDYINVRASGDTEGDVVGTLRTNDSVYIEDVDENGWYKIRSGNVEGYVAGYLIATGEEAEEVAKNTAYTYAQIGADYLNIRSDATEDAEVLDTVGQDANLEVVEDLGDWVKVVTDDGIYGYVSTDYVNTQTVYPTGETIEEQAEREEQEYLEAVAQQEAEYEAYLAEQEAAAASYTDTAYTDTAAADTAYTDTTAADTTYTDTAAQTQTASAGDVDALYQAYLVAQDAAMTATDEADATAKANAAIEAYNAYLAACGSTQTVAAVEESTPAAADTTTADTTYTDTTAADTTYTETAAADTATDSTASETAQDTSYSSGSSTGAAVASYASQFIGNPYVYGGTSLTNGADCSGFTMAVYANFGVSLPHNAAAQSGCGTPVSMSDLQPGDLIFYGDGGIGHVAIYAGGGTVIHASNEQTGIKTSVYNYRTPVAAVRLV